LFAYEATLRVPLIVAELGGAARRTVRAAAVGEVSSTSARHIDLAPTILEAVGLPIPGELSGRSLLTAAERRDGSGRTSYFEAMSGVLNRGAAPLAGVLVDREKLIHLPPRERYDRAAEPGERVNLAGRAPDHDRALMQALAGYHAALPGGRVTETPDAVARLRTLGYLSGRGVSGKPRYTERDDPKRLVELETEVHGAVEAAGQGRLDDAVRMYQHALSVRPEFALASRHLAFLRARRGSLGGAIDVPQRAMGAGAGDPEIVTDLAGDVTDAGRPAQAIQLLEPLAADPLVGADTLNTLGIAYAQAGRKDAARQAFERGLAADPSSSIPLENLGLLALERGQLGASRDFFARAIAADP